MSIRILQNVTSVIRLELRIKIDVRDVAIFRDRRHATRDFGSRGEKIHVSPPAFGTLATVAPRRRVTEANTKPIKGKRPFRNKSCLGSSSMSQPVGNQSYII
jgi:hypothetical protein